MALSRIWTAFILIALLVATGRYFMEPGQKEIFNDLVTGKSNDTTYIHQIDSATIAPALVSRLQTEKSVPFQNNKMLAKNSGGGYIEYRLQSANGIFETSKDAVTLSLGLIGIMALFLGFMSIAEKAGGIRLLSKIIGPFFSKIFPDVPKNHPSMGHMVLNYSANLLGLDNAATPFGIRAMESLQELNPNKEVASNAEIMFIALHASGLTLVPTTIIADRVALGSKHPTDIFIPCMIATFVATVAALLIVSARQKIKIIQPVVLMWIMGISAFIAAIILYVRSLDAQGVQIFSTTLSNVIILLIFVLIILGGVYKKINIFEAFINGAKDGFDVAVKIIPYLVGLLVAISLLRNSGALDYVLNVFKYGFSMLGFDTRIVDALPTALLKPLSGSGARAIMIDTLKTHGPDSFVGNLASVFRGSADTTFYIIAVYFGAVGIKNSRYAVSSMLLADLAGILTGISIAYLFFRS